MEQKKKIMKKIQKRKIKKCLNGTFFVLRTKGIKVLIPGVDVLC